MCKNQFKVRSYPTILMLSIRYDMTAQWDVSNDMEGTQLAQQYLRMSRAYSRA